MLGSRGDMKRAYFIIIGVIFILLVALVTAAAAKTTGDVTQGTGRGALCNLVCINVRANIVTDFLFGQTCGC